MFSLRILLCSDGTCEEGRRGTNGECTRAEMLRGEWSFGRKHNGDSLAQTRAVVQHPRTQMSGRQSHERSSQAPVPLSQLTDLLQALLSDAGADALPTAVDNLALELLYVPELRRKGKMRMPGVDHDVTIR